MRIGLFVLTIALVVILFMVAGCGPAAPAEEISSPMPVVTDKNTETATIPLPTATATATPTETSAPPTATIEPSETPPPTATTIPPTPTSLPPLSESGGGAIAFVSERSGRPGIYIMNADGSDQRQLTGDFDAQPDWSPDGSKIAFSTRRGDLVAIFTVDVATHESRQLTDTDRSPSAPDWSPDGGRFTFIYNPAHPGINYELYLMKANGESFDRLTQSAGYQTYSGPDWSPDGRQIVVAADLAENFDLYLTDSDGSTWQQLTFHEADDRSPAWSPDGSQIAFESRRDGNWEIFVMNADGSDIRNITNSPARELWPSWSPDGSRIAFQSDRDRNWEIYVMNADGTEQIRLTEDDAKDSEPAWKP